MNIQPKPLSSIQLHNEFNRNTNKKSIGTNFNEILSNTLQQNKEVIFSKHANMRLNSRNIKLNTEQLEKINNGVNEASKKGIKDSLMLIDNIALVVNIQKKTVITALEKSETDQHIFTNIDGAILL